MRKLTRDEISERRATLETLDRVDRMPVTAALISVRSAYNVGSMFRTSDGAGLERLCLSGYTPRPPQKDVLKTALGATESVPWEYANDPLDAVGAYRKRGYRIGALEQTAESVPYYSLDASVFPLFLLVGNEIGGTPQRALDECDLAIEVPQYGIKQSLNVAVAFGVAAFELRKIYDAANRLG
jgi:tRNA G18 (ribose-2'-O)-methylase SpoU